ncbi:MAG TPA: DUF58 domain-containing protein [Gemmatales bacterium]|nr:DUF58 domain-containing protein [Gemmatales bacterium]
MNERQNGKTPKQSWVLHQSWGPSLAGFLWIVFSLLLMVQGLIRAFNLVTFIASFLVAMWVLNLVVTLLSGPKLKMLRIKRRLLGTVHAGSPVMQSIEIENEGRGTVTGVRIEEQGMKPRHTIGLNHLPSKGRLEYRHQCIATVRGPFAWKPLIASTGNPFGLFRMLRDCPGEEVESLVLPMLGQVDQQQFQRWLKRSRRASQLQTRVRAKRTVTPADFYGIRAYRPGDSARWIHWRTTARVGSPMVREFEEPPQDHITVVLDASLPDTEETLQAGWLAARKKNLKAVKEHFRKYAPPTEEELAFRLAELRQREAPFAEPLHLVEQAVSLACSLAHLWTRRLGSTITLVVLDGREEAPVRLESSPNLRQLVPLMERLAVVQATPKPDVARIQGELERRALPAGPVIVITAGTGSQAGNLLHGLHRQAQILDMSKSRQIRRFFQSKAKAGLKGLGSGAV